MGLNVQSTYIITLVWLIASDARTTKSQNPVIKHNYLIRAQKQRQTDWFSSFFSRELTWARSAENQIPFSLSFSKWKLESQTKTYRNMFNYQFNNKLIKPNMYLYQTIHATNMQKILLHKTRTPRKLFSLILELNHMLYKHDIEDRSDTNC